MLRQTIYRQLYIIRLIIMSVIRMLHTRIMGRSKSDKSKERFILFTPLVQIPDCRIGKHFRRKLFSGKRLVIFTFGIIVIQTGRNMAIRFIGMHASEEYIIAQSKRTVKRFLVRMPFPRGKCFITIVP